MHIIYLSSFTTRNLLSCDPKTTQSTLGIAPFFSHLLVVNLSDSCRFKSSRCSKFATMKWAEQSTEVLDGFHCGRCLWTKQVHFARTELSLGKRCIDIPSIFELFLQLTLPGPPATQYFPRDFPFARLFCVSAMTITFWMNASTSDVTPSIWPRHQMGQLQALVGNIVSLKTRL